MMRDPLKIPEQTSKPSKLALVPRETMLYSNNTTVHPGLSAVRQFEAKQGRNRLTT